MKYKSPEGWWSPRSKSGHPSPHSSKADPFGAPPGYRYWPGQASPSGCCRVLRIARISCFTLFPFAIYTSSPRHFQPAVVHQAYSVRRISSGSSFKKTIPSSVCFAPWANVIGDRLPNHVLPTECLALEYKVVEAPWMAVLIPRFWCLSNRNFDRHWEFLKRIWLHSTTRSRGITRTNIPSGLNQRNVLSRNTTSIRRFCPSPISQS